MPHEHVLMVLLWNVNFRSLVPKLMSVLCCLIKANTCQQHWTNSPDHFIKILVAISHIDFTIKASIIMYLTLKVT